MSFCDFLLRLKVCSTSKCFLPFHSKQKRNLCNWYLSWYWWNSGIIYLNFTCNSAWADQNIFGGGGSEEYFCLPGKLKSYFSVTLLCECIGFEVFWRVRYPNPLTSFSVHSYMTVNALFNAFIKKKSFIHFAFLFVLHVGKNTPVFFPRLHRNWQGRECTCSWEILATQRTPLTEDIEFISGLQSKLQCFSYTQTPSVV